MEPSNVFNLLTPESIPESSCRTEKNRKRKSRNQNPLFRRTFKSSISRTKKVVTPALQMGNLSLQELDDFSLHITDLLQDELCLLQRKQQCKALSGRDLETVLRLRFPNILRDAASEFGKKATDKYFKMEVESENSEQESGMPNDDPLPGSSKDKSKANITKKNRKNSNSGKFKAFILKKKSVLMPKLKLRKLTLHQLDDFLNHMMEMFFEEIHTLQRKKRQKTLDVNDAAAVLKLCLPPKYAIAASKFAIEAVNTYNYSRSFLCKQ